MYKATCTPTRWAYVEPFLSVLCGYLHSKSCFPLKCDIIKLIYGKKINVMEKSSKVLKMEGLRTLRGRGRINFLANSTDEHQTQKVIKYTS